MGTWGLNIETLECTRGSHYRALEVLVLREAVIFYYVRWLMLRNKDGKKKCKKRRPIHTYQVVIILDDLWSQSTKESPYIRVWTATLNHADQMFRASDRTEYRTRPRTMACGTHEHRGHRSSTWLRVWACGDTRARGGNTNGLDSVIGLNHGRVP
jgi:hypothetical protein